MADSFSNALNWYMSHTTAVAIILSFFYEHMKVIMLILAQEWKYLVFFANFCNSSLQLKLRMVTYFLSASISSLSV